MHWRNQIIHSIHSANRFIRFVVHHFIQDDCPYIASALAFTSLLAIVPLMSVGLAIFSTFPVFQDLAQPLQNFIFENFVPATGKIIQNYLQQFTSQVSKLSIWGIIFLVITALLVMFTIEQAMNKIWRVGSSRKGVPAFMLYWSILSLAPIILGLSLAASSYLFSLPMMQDHHAPSLFLHWFPVMLSLTGFTFLYIVVPNCTVRFHHAFFGAFFAAILFETAKQAFAYYLIRYNTYALLYGAFATVPIFFIWVYWVWLITLLGAEISYAFSVHHERRKGQKLDGFSHALLWLYQLWLAQQHGQGLRFNELIDAYHHPFEVDANQMINQLIELKLIHITANNLYRMSRNINTLSLYELTQILPYKLPTMTTLRHHPAITKPWLEPLSNAEQALQESLQMSLEALFKKKKDR